MTSPLAGTWKDVEATEAVTYYRRTGEGTFDAPLALAAAKRRVLSKEEAGSDALLAEAGLVWHLWADHLGVIVPRVGDVVQDGSGVRWTVLQVEVQSLAQRFRLTCLMER